LGSWLSSLWHSAGPEVAAAVAVASGNPELALPAAQAASAAGGGKPNPPKAVAAPVALQAPPQGIGAAYQALTPLDREIVVVGGVVLGAVVLSRVLFPPRYGRG
jgi:hypothetical protein